MTNAISTRQFGSSLYLFVINIFVLPIASGGLLHFPNGTVDADTFVITVPMAEGQFWLALLVFLGGFSAAASMVIVETVALSTMVSNDLVMPLLLGLRLVRVKEQATWATPVGHPAGSDHHDFVVGLSFTFNASDPSNSLVALGLSLAAVACLRRRSRAEFILERRHAPRRTCRSARGFRFGAIRYRCHPWPRPGASAGRICPRLGSVACHCCAPMRFLASPD
ncbi:MAG: hypothetical protein R2932_16320 [Caldilineaceae bacterium]